MANNSLDFLKLCLNTNTLSKLRILQKKNKFKLE